MDNLLNIATNFLNPNTLTTNLNNVNKFATDIVEVNNSVNILKYVFRAKYIIILSIIIWCISLLYFYHTETDKDKKNDIIFTNSVLLNSITIISIMWLLSTLIVFILPFINETILNIIKNIIKK